MTIPFRKSDVSAMPLHSLQDYFFGIVEIKFAAINSQPIFQQVTWKSNSEFIDSA